jgi:hypothetical protein
LVNGEHNRLQNLLASLLGLNTLTRNPFFEVNVHKSHLGSAQFHEGNSPFLDQAPDEPFRTSQAVRRPRHV